MSRQAITPDHLFDRPWRPGRRFTQPGGRLRRVLMLAVLLSLSAVIGTYAYVTDSVRVRAMAESYLSSLVGGPVKVGGATLSVFEGLRLDNVRVYVDDQTEAADSLLFSAQTFLIKYDPRTMIGGKLEATQIVAQKPQVHLAENHDRGEWNYERLARRRHRERAPTPGVPGKTLALPEVLLRNARVMISEIRGGREVARGSMTVEGRLGATADADRYAFYLQSRGVSEGIGPYAIGSVSTSTGQVAAQLMNFAFGRDFRSMLPAAPRAWCKYHELDGAVSMPDVNFTPARDGKPEQFKIVTVLNGVTLSVSPEEWMGRREVARLEGMRKSAQMWGGLYHLAGNHRGHSPAHRILSLLTPSKVTLKNVAGSFVFTNAGVEVKDVSGFVESNGLKINGRIHGYRPDAPLSLTLSSFDRQNLTIPASPRYIHSLPREVREVYEQFKPEGECRLALRVERTEPGERPVVGGSVQIVDGRFVFSRFPYPLRNVTGRIAFSHDPGGAAKISVNVRGNGLPNGPNRDTVLEIKTFGEEIGPIGTNICGVNVRISGTNVASEDALRNAFPPDVRQALANFDAHGTGRLPGFRGDFVTEVVRPVGERKRWSFDTDIRLADASGVLRAFPYPLSNLAGTLLIRSGYTELVNLHTKDGKFTVNGRVAWTTSDGPRGPQPRYRATGAELSPRADEAVTTELKIVARDVPIDDDLLEAVPKDRREWVAKLGLSGRLDVDGRVFAKPFDEGEKVEWVVENASPTEGDGLPSSMDYDLKLGIKGGTMRPFGRAFVATDVDAMVHLTPDRLVIERAAARRGAGELSAAGNIDWPKGKPRVVLDGTAKRLKLDDALYELLPDAGKRGWDETQPQGTLDAQVHYESGGTTTTRPANYRVVLKPRELSVTLKSMPYRLDALTGSITVDGNRIAVDDVTGRHGDGKISVSGSGILGAASIWDLRIGGERLVVDDELLKALPKALAGLAEAIKLKGTVGFDLTKFAYRGADQPAPMESPNAAAPDPEIDVQGAVTFSAATLDVGVPLTNADGTLTLDAAVRDGHLETLRGGLDFPTMNMAGRAAKNFRGELFKPSGRTELRLDKMRTEIAGGVMSGGMTLVYPDDGPSRYALELVIRDADVKALAWEKDDADIKGRLTASLSLAGSWGDAAQRRGRGDVMVQGRELRRIPLVLGLLQVTNLALPISSPFNEATAVYSLDGSRVVFEQIKLTAKNMLMEGNGSLDFSTKKVDLAFTTDNPSGLMQIPFLKDIWRGARNEMLKIRVRGTVQEPEVSAQSMGTFWTTVDEVFDAGKKVDGDERKQRGK
jgi:hypothetical protein